MTNLLLAALLLMALDWRFAVFVRVRRRFRPERDMNVVVGSGGNMTRISSRQNRS